MASPGSTDTTRSHRTNPFEGPDPIVIRNLNILVRVPVVLDHLTSTYYAWKTYFSLVFREYNLRDHIDGSVDSRFMEDDEEWTSIDATLIRWFYTTISKDLFHTVVSADDDAHAVWTKLNGLFTDNALQRKVFLHGEFFGCQQLDSSVDDYCMHLKKLVDELRDLGEKVSDELLLSTLIGGLNEDFGNAASNIPLITNPTFPKIVAYLKLEERRMRMSHTQAPPPPGFPYPAPPQAPPPPAEQQQRRGGRRGRGGRKQQQPAAHGGAPRQPQHQLPPAPWQAGQNPWTGVVHAYSMPIPRAPVSGFFGARTAPHQALYAAPQSYPPAPLYGPSAAYGLPSASGFAAPPPQPLPSAPALSPVPWDPALLAALHTAPMPQQYTGSGDWYMDTGATVHMAANPGCPYPDGAPPM
nr:synaptic defective enhancer 1-like [Aegilops tauschii subsp. strangulata]